MRHFIYKSKLVSKLVVNFIVDKINNLVGLYANVIYAKVG